MMGWLQVRRFPRWLAVPAHLIGFAGFHAALPWALSLIGAKHGWEANGRPGTVNLLGLIPVIAGFSVCIWSIREHYREAPAGWLLETTSHYPTPAYLLAKGPSRYSRNPIYLAEVTIWAGWIFFYGSFAILSIFAVMSLLLGPVILPREERGLEARFGDAYREYCRATPRWLGRVRT